MEQSGAKSQRSLNVELTFTFGYPATKQTKQKKITTTEYLLNSNIFEKYFVTWKVRGALN